MVDDVFGKDEDGFSTGLKSRSIFEKIHKYVAPLVNRRWLGVKSVRSKV